MKDRTRKITNGLLVVVILSLVVVIIISVVKIRDIHNRRVEEYNQKEVEREDEKQNYKEVIETDGSQEVVTESYDYEEEYDEELEDPYLLDYAVLDLESIPAYDGVPYLVINNGIPDFDDSQKTMNSFEYYSPLDWLGRCGVATANISLELMPTEDRGSIGQIKPSGWHTVKYPELISDLYLYNRCHLIAYSLCGENDNEKNLITGTRYMNVSGMLPFENDVSDYIKRTGNHVLYRVTPCFVGNELVARGVHMEALSVEDGGLGICFNVFVYNVQPGIEIDYLTGDSWIAE